MTIRYNFYDIYCKVPNDIGHYNNIDDEPSYKSEMCEVDYDYEVEVDFDDVFDFIKPNAFDEWDNEKQSAYKKAFTDLYDYVDLYKLEENEEFVEFMTDKYEYKAHDECQDSQY